MFQNLQQRLSALSGKKKLIKWLNCRDLAAFVTIFSYVFTAHVQKRLFRISCKNFVRFIDPDFLTVSEISAIWGRFQLIFSSDKIKSTIFLLPVYLTYYLEGVPLEQTPTMIISTRFEADMIICCWVTALLVPIRYVTLWPWPWTVVIHGGSCGQPHHQVWRSYAYPFLSYDYDVCHRLPWTMRLQPLCMRHITWCDILAMWRRFQSISSLCKLNVRHISTSSLFCLLT